MFWTYLKIGHIIIGVDIATRVRTSGLDHFNIIINPNTQTINKNVDFN